MSIYIMRFCSVGIFILKSACILHFTEISSIQLLSHFHFPSGKPEYYSPMEGICIVVILFESVCMDVSSECNACRSDFQQVD